MSTTLIGPEIESPPDLDDSGRGFDDKPPGDGGGGGGESRPRYDTYRTAVWILLIPVVMLFVGLTSALFVRRGVSDDWARLEIPGILYLNTLILLASSYALEMARRRLRDPASAEFRKWLGATTGLGIVFLAGQLLGWQELARRGVFLASNPSSSFFYVLTATHGAHLVGGMAALLYLSFRVFRREFGARRQSALHATAIYWHFMDALWIYLLFLMLFWR